MMLYTSNEGYGMFRDTHIDSESDIQVLGPEWIMVRRDVMEAPDFDPDTAILAARQVYEEGVERERAWQEEYVERAALLPAKTACPSVVYRYFNDRDELLYVGKTIDMEVRERAHMKRIWWPDVARRTIEEYPTERAALDAEDVAIKTENPLYNRAGVVRR